MFDRADNSFTIFFFKYNLLFRDGMDEGGKEWDGMGKNEIEWGNRDNNTI